MLSRLTTLYRSLLCVGSLTICAPTVVGQLWSQPWTAGSHQAYDSASQSCAFQNPLTKVAFGDFDLNEVSFINSIVWWGSPVALTTQLAQQQLSRPFRIAIHLELGNCQPGMQVWSTCATSSVTFAGLDCNGKRIYRHAVNLVTPILLPGGRYWISISEEDASSVTPGQVNWRWAGRPPVPATCPGLLTANFTTFARLNDGCTMTASDVSFELY